MCLESCEEAIMKVSKKPHEMDIMRFQITKIYLEPHEDAIVRVRKTQLCVGSVTRRSS